MRKILRGHVFNIRFLFTLCLGVACTAIHAQMSGTYTINSAVATGGTNFQSFTDAATALGGGVTGPVIFNVQSGSGPYNEQVVLNNITGTSATNTITFNCNGVTLSFLSTNSFSRAGVKLNNTSYVTFDNLVVTPQAMNNGEYGYGFHLLNNADHNTIQNCHIINNVNPGQPEAMTGIVINGNDQKPTDPGNSNCDFNLIQQNIIEGGGMAITLSSIPVGASPAQYMDGNKLLKNSITNWFINGIEMYYNSNTQVDGNDFTGGMYTYITCGIHLGQTNYNVNVINNRIHEFMLDPSYVNTALYGIRINSKSVAGKENIIANNAIYNWSSGDAGLQYGICSDSGSFFNIYHNTVSLDDQTQLSDLTRGVSLEKISDVSFMNNIVSVSRNVKVQNYGLFVFSNGRFTSEHNVFYVPALTLPAKSYMGSFNGDFDDNLSIWRSKTGLDLFSAALNPSFVNVAAGNLSPTAQSIDNMGVYVNINTDINANARNTKSPDPGCVEFTSAACSTPVTVGSLIISPDSSICQGPKVAMGLTGNSAGSGQTYTWQTSSTQLGTYSNITSALDYPYLEATPSSTLYYRVAVTCGASTVYSSPMKVLVTTPLNGGTYTINNALPTGGVNFNSFSDAARALQCGLNGSIVFNVASGSGPYQEQMIIPAISTAPNRTVTFNGNGATITYATTSANTSVIKLDGADYITIDSLNVTVQGAATGYGFGVLLMNDADYNTIKRCTINLNTTSLSTYYGGIIISAKDDNPNDDQDPNNCDYNLIANNTVTGGYYGITCASKTNQAHDILTSIGNTIKGNKITDNCGQGIFIGGTGSLLVDSNDISHPSRTVFAPIVPFQAIYVKGINAGLNITQNRIHNLFDKARTIDNQLTGIAFIGAQGYAAQPNMVSNNLLYYFRGVGLQEGLYTINSSYLKFYHNTVSLEDSAANAVNETRGFGMFGGDSLGMEFKNNSIVIKRGGPHEKYGIWLDQADSNLVANYNNYYMRSPKGHDTIGVMGRLIYRTLNDWLVTRKDSSSISIDPVYNDIAKGDLTPTKLLFENRGTYVGIPVDQLNNTRNKTNPDIGAIEFTICSPLSKPVLTVEDAETNIIKFAWNAIPNTTGYRVSRDNLNWTIPSSGAMGLSHTVTGLKPTDKITLWVKALGTRVDCPEYISDSKEGQALTDGVFVPNTFTPNGDAHNDYFKVYSNVTKTIRWMVFNQWGEKVFEANDIQAQWDGTYKGKPQPVGVYVYVVSGMLTDGTKVSQKGTFNLVR